MLNWYTVSFWDGKPNWDFFKAIAENEQQIIDFLDKNYPDRKNCYFNRAGEPTAEPNDWTEIRLLGKVPIPLILRLK